MGVLFVTWLGEGFIVGGEYLIWVVSFGRVDGISRGRGFRGLIVCLVGSLVFLFVGVRNFCFSV